ncbi:MAG: helix-turn-helix domain-containing protein [Lachnospiraceae bacterium]|nr:helix-turn-helix domain-containing protein [Lachnospiraceae bacterium]
MIEGKRSDRVIQVNEVNIGDNIRRQRLKAGYKQTDLVKKLQIEGIDISVFSYNRIEKGTQNPTTTLLIVLCQIFSCDMNSLFDPA